MINVVINTKGGVTKSTVAAHLLAGFIHQNTGSPVQYFEIDDQNESIKNLSKSQILNPTLVKTENLSKFVEESIMFSDDVVVDVGGNLTALMFLERLKLLGGFFAPTTYFIPLTDGDQDAINAADTHVMIREFDKESQIVYVLNKCINKGNQELLERQFMSYFGNEILDVKPIKTDKKTSYIAVNYNTIYNVTGRLGKTIHELSTDNYDDEYRTTAQEFYKDKSNQELYKQVRRLMFLKEQSTVAKQIFENEYLEIFAQLKKLQK